MPLEPGRQIAHYRVIEKIGEGGMGEVYRAEDTKLGRSVAIKVLPEAFVQDGPRLARFTREAQLLASLNHPNIAGIHGIETAGDITALALELIEGETLAERIARGPMPPDEAATVALQIAEALEAAHESGIIHRDLKPGNVKFAADGRVKVLDFGLAKSLAPPDPGGDPSQSPTLTTPGTVAGTILGTAAYMSPEQAKGRPLDRRTDIWSFGAVLMEMLTGRSPFARASVPETLAEVLKGHVDWTWLPADTPAPLCRLLTRCLTRDPRWRLADMADARLELREALEDQPVGGGETAGASAARTTAPARTRLWLAASTTVALASLAALAWLSLRPEPPVTPLRLEITLPPGLHLDARPAISPDGTTVAYIATGDGRGSRLFIRRLSEFEPQEVGEASTPGSPFFSPDSAWVGYVADGGLWKVAVAGGAPVRLADSPGTFGGAWGPGDAIVYVPNLNEGLHLLAPGDRTARQITRPDGGPAGYAHVFPQFLPDGRILYTVWGDPEDSNFILDLETGQSIPVRGSSFSAQSVSFYASGHLIGGDQAAGLIAAPVDLSIPAVTGPAHRVAAGVYWFYAVHQSYADISTNGTLLYAAGNPRLRQLVWVDSNGNVTPAVEEEDAYYFPGLSHDGRRAVVTAGANLLILDLERRTRSRLTSLKGDELIFRPVWLPGDRRVLFSSNRSGKWNLYARNSDGTGQDELILDADFTPYPESVSPDGVVSMSVSMPGRSLDVWTMAPGAEPQPFVTSGFSTWGSRFSPDGTLIAYSAVEAGRPEIFVQPFAAGGERLMVSTGGGSAPVWSGDGTHLYYSSGSAIYKTRLTSRAPLRFSPPVRLLEGDFDLDNWSRFSVDPGQERFLVVLPRPESYARHLRIVTGWTAEQGLTGGP